MGRRRHRSRGSKRRFSRRRLLMLLGGSSIFGGLVASTGAFSTVQTPRPSDVGSTEDANALLGVSLAPYVDAGQSGENLVTITNNASVPLTVQVTLANASGDVSPSNPFPTLQPSDTQLFTVDLHPDATAGENALTIDISATDGSSMNISMSRTLGVRNFLRRLEDRTENTNAVFYLSYRLQNMDNFQSYELIVENLGPSRDDLGTRTFTSTDVEHVFRIPESGSDGNAEGDTYEFTMRIYDTNGLAIERVLTDVADGSDPPDNDDIGGGPEDPFVVDFTITDETLNDNTEYTVDYEVDNTTNLKEVQVTFDNQANNWSDQTVTSTNAPTGTVSYSEGGTEGDTYDITVETINDNDISTDSLTKTDVADGDDLGGGGGGCTIGSNVNPGTLQFNNLQGFEAKAGPDRWDISQIQVQDNDGDNDLNQLKLEITDSGGTVRATRTTQLSGQQYQEQNIKINPDSGSYDVASGETYTLTATVCDADGNSLTETRQDTA